MFSKIVGTGIVISGLTVIPFVSHKMSNKDIAQVEAAAAANFASGRSSGYIENEIPVLKSNKVIVDTYITGPPKLDDYPKGPGLVYTD